MALDLKMFYDKYWSQLQEVAISDGDKKKLQETIN
jgi:hypothetical protein